MPTFKQFLKEHDYDSEVFTDELEQSEINSINSGAYSMIKSYFEKADKNGKLAMHSLGVDIGEAIAKYLSEEFVDEESFKNDDVKLKYMNAVRDKVSESLSEKIKDLFESVGQTADEIRLTLPIK